MRLTSRGRHAISAMVDLKNNGKPITLTSIAERQFISLSYLEQLAMGDLSDYIDKENKTDITIAQIS